MQKKVRAQDSDQDAFTAKNLLLTGKKTLLQK